ncbi:MAG TPA: tRNA wybutosine-synthesizing 3 family protein [Candidatus Nanoarchaeia archaeon]|nr:tRNA wybutosine-synthesizing 3 family protein [Candidatus Nanoarchaeia archaeon]
MLQNRFDYRKKTVLEKLDKSSKGNWDKKIIKLCYKLNKKKDYYTTSSCAGRMMLMVDQDKKGPGLFLMVYHNIVSFDKLKSNLIELSKKEKRNIKFKQEPCIMHVVCRTLDNAWILYDKAKKSGWKRSGLISWNNSFVLELMSTEKIEFPIILNGKILASDDFLRLVVKKANENLKKNWGKIEKLKKLI